MMKFAEIERLFLYGKAEEVAALRCPDCGASMTANFTDIKGRRSLGVQRSTFCTRANIDGVKEDPPWVSVLGNRYTTK